MQYLILHEFPVFHMGIHPDNHFTGQQDLAKRECSFKCDSINFDGNRSGEGYFRALDICFAINRKVILATLLPNILLDLRSGSNRLVSSGIGKTTCAWIHPSEKNVLYASTHLDPNSTDKQKQEYELRNSGRNKKYSWDYDPSYDLFIKNLNSNSETRLTNNFVYDAECAFSPDGEKIVFTSNGILFRKT